MLLKSLLLFVSLTINIFPAGEIDVAQKFAVEGRLLTTTDSVSLFIKVKGHGTPCLYIHGGPGSGSYWLEKFSGEMLEKNFRMIYLDQRGVGRSSSPKDNNYSLERMIKDFEEIREALGIKEWIILGHSFGGVLQTAYAEKHPGVIKGMIMVNCSLSMKESLTNSWLPNACKILNITDKTFYNDESIPPLERLTDLLKKLKEKNLIWKMAYASQENERLVNDSYREISNWNGDQENYIFNYDEYWFDYRPTTSNLKMPVLFFYGRFDYMVGAEHYKGVHFPEAILWGCDAGHFPFLENKTELEKAVANFKERYRL